MATSNGSAAASNGGPGKPLVFVSYSHRDTEWKDRVAVHLKALELDEQIELWDDSRIDVGGKWRDDIVHALNRAGVAVLLVSRDFLASEFIIRQEVKHFLEQAARGRLPILPILINKCTWKVIRWLRELQMLPGNGETIEDNHLDNYNDIFIDLAVAVSEIVTDPKFAPPQVAEDEIPQIATRSMATVSGQSTTQVALSDNTVIQGEYRQAAARMSTVAEPSAPEWPLLYERCVDIDRLPNTGAELFGRDLELDLLDKAWASETTNVVSLVAWGGVGKSTLVNKWLEGLRADNWRGAQRVLGWSFFSQGTGERVTSADQFVDEALRFFNDPEPEAGSPWAKGERLADLARKNKALLILDGLEPLQDRYQGIKDPALQRLVEELARDNAGLCVITTREAVKELEDFSASTIACDLEQISPQAGRALLRVKGVRGTDAELEKTSEAFGNHALAINLLANWLRAIPGHQIAQAATIPECHEIPESSRHPRRVMAVFAHRFGEDSVEVELLRLLGLFDRPATKGALDALREPPPIPGLTNHTAGLEEAGWLRLLENLRELGLVAPASTHAPDELDAHPLVREHFGAELREKHLEAWRAGHARLYEHFKALPEKQQPDTLEEMAPLFQAVFHGCQAGRHQQALLGVYYTRIQRDGRTNYCMSRLGAVGADLAALAGFFEPPWEGPVRSITHAHQGAVLGWAGFRLRALGRLTEAVTPMRASLDMAVEDKDWGNAANAANNVSEVWLTLGEVSEAIALADRSVEYADRSGDAFMRMAVRTYLADAQHQAGERARAEELFWEAEQLQAERQPGYPRLYSLQGYLYCDLLLELGRHAEVCDRAAQALEWAKMAAGLLSIALGHLSLGRAELLGYEADGSGDLAEAEKQLNQAVDGLRKAGQIDEVPRGLLARASYFRAVKQYERAQRDLDEAMRIATRSGMRLSECDAHLEYARLELARGNRQAARRHLDEAEKLVAATGYHRRDKDLEELKAALG